MNIKNLSNHHQVLLDTLHETNSFAPDMAGFDEIGIRPTFLMGYVSFRECIEKQTQKQIMLFMLDILMMRCDMIQ